MSNTFKRFIFSIFFVTTTITAQAADFFPELPDGAASRTKEKSFKDNKQEKASAQPSSEPGSSLGQPSAPEQIQPGVQQITASEKSIQPYKKRSKKKKAKGKIHQTTTPPVPDQKVKDVKTPVENSEVKRVEKWLEENEAMAKDRPIKKAQEPVKQSPAKQSTQTFSVYLSPEPGENKQDSKNPEKMSHLNVQPPARTPKPLVVPKLGDEKKRAEDTIKFQAEVKSAEAGDAEAQLSVGLKLYQGQGVLQDRKQGFDWLLKAAEQGKFSPDSLHLLGQAYYKGIDTEKNYVEARKWLRLLADQDNYSAKNDLAYMLYYGIGGEKDYAKAFELYQQASKHGDVYAQANLGLMYANGTGTEVDKARAYAWYSFAASQGNIAAARNRDALLHDMSWNELSSAQRISVELYNEFVQPGANQDQSVQTKLTPRQLPSETQQ